MQKIGESELIINPKGAVYHLNIKPGEMADCIITVGDPDRVQEVSKHFDTIEFKTQHREFVTHTGYIGKKRISVISSGIGPDNIDIVLNEIDAVVNVDFESRTVKQNLTSLQIIRMGTSGSLQLDVPVDSLVASSYGIGLDNVLHFYKLSTNAKEQQLNNEFANYTQLYKSNIIPYAVQCSQSLISNFGSDYIKGITVTCPGFYAPQGRVVRAELQFKNLIDTFQTFTFEQNRITNFEMETSAIYGLGKIFGHQCLSINTIVANRQSKTFSTNATVAIENMITKSLAIIENI